MPYDMTHSPALQSIQTSGSARVLHGCLPSEALGFFFQLDMGLGERRVTCIQVSWQYAFGRHLNAKTEKLF